MSDSPILAADSALKEAATPRWYRSLYWRIAVGLFAFLALMLAAEAALFLWISDRIAGSMPARSPQRLAALVASDVGAALTRDPALDLNAYLRQEYGAVLQTFFVFLRDGRVATNHDDVPADVMAAARAEAATALIRQGRAFGGRRGSRGAPPPGDTDPRPDRPPPPFEPSEGPRLRGAFAAVIVDGMPAGRVGVFGARPSFTRIVREFGPTMALVAGGVLLVGTVLIASVVFGPSRRRLSEVQSATVRLGSGDLAARAPEYGGDEVAALARSFNRMADELASRARDLEASDKARRQLLADVSHELMTPLTAMRGYVETLTMAELQLDAATRQRYMGIITDETHRLEQIIGDLLDLARLEGGGITMRRERVDVETLFGRVAARHERELQARRISLATHVHPQAAAIVGDPDRLEQALQNLAANALRHTPPDGEITLTAEPATTRDSGLGTGDSGLGTRDSAGPRGVLIRVRDSGAGILPEHLPLIFDRFYKGDAARKATGGSGLGLSIVKAIVEAHGGTIAARNEGGAVFDIVLPSSTQDSVR
jgi:signal transduction histidine kinase